MFQSGATSNASMQVAVISLVAAEWLGKSTMHAIVTFIGGKVLTFLSRGTGLILSAHSHLRERCFHAISLVASALT
jgi:hypothetical protein